MSNSPKHSHKAARLALAALCFVALTNAAAAQASRQFLVTASLAQSPITGFCSRSVGPNGFGATVTVVCSTGAVVDVFAGPGVLQYSDAYRNLFQISAGGNILGTIDSYSGGGTVTSWRVLDIEDREYLEMVVGW